MLIGLLFSPIRGLTNLRPNNFYWKFSKNNSFLPCKGLTATLLDIIEPVHGHCSGSYCRKSWQETLVAFPAQKLSSSIKSWSAQWFIQPKFTII